MDGIVTSIYQVMIDDFITSLWRLRELQTTNVLHTVVTNMVVCKVHDLQGINTLWDGTYIMCWVSYCVVLVIIRLMLVKGRL